MTPDERDELNREYGEIIITIEVLQARLQIVKQAMLPELQVEEDARQQLARERLVAKQLAKAKEMNEGTPENFDHMGQPIKK